MHASTFERNNDETLRDPHVNGMERARGDGYIQTHNNAKEAGFLF